MSGAPGDPSSTREAPEVRTLLGAEQIAERVRQLGTQIARDYSGRAPVLICVLKGSFVFAADLVRAMDVPVRIEFLGVQSYGDDTTSSGVVQITQDVTRPIQGEDVLIVEDIVDTGLTLDYICEQIRARSPKSLRVCTLLVKPARLKKKVTVDYVGFEVQDVFVVGYGLDFAQRYRNLPCIGVIDDVAQATPGAEDDPGGAPATSP